MSVSTQARRLSASSWKPLLELQSALGRGCNLLRMQVGLEFRLPASGRVPWSAAGKALVSHSASSRQVPPLMSAGVTTIQQLASLERAVPGGSLGVL